MIRSYFLIAAWLLVTAAANAASSHEGVCQTLRGEKSSLCTVAVLDFESNQLARIYADQDLTQALPNPLVADQEGAFRFFAEGGVYELNYSGGAPNVGRNKVGFAWLAPRTAAAWLRPGAPIHAITAYGATANDASDDDLPAIQAAVEAASADHGVVFIPEGVFDVAPAGNCAPCIAIRSGVSIIGGGGSIVRVRANSGSFDALFAQTSGSPEEVLFSGFTIDHNIARNAGTVGRATGRFGYLIRFFAGRRIRIENMRFLYAGVNAVTLNGTEIADIEMINNYAEYQRDPGVEPYDNTAFYTDGYRITVAYNTVIGKILPGMPMVNGAAIGAIELHGGPAVAVGNEVVDVRVCMSLVSAWSGAHDPRQTNAIAALGNRCVNANEGIRLGAMDNRRLKGVAVAGNDIQIAQTKWKQHLSMGIELEWASVGMNGDFEDITIANNTVRFEDEGQGSTGATAVLTNVGIGLAPAGNIRGAVVVGNQVTGAPLMGMRVGNLLHPASSYSDIVITGNAFANYGQNRLANRYFLLGIRTEGRQRNLVIEHNRFESTVMDGLSRPAIAMVAAGSQTATDYQACVVRENEGAEFSQIDPSCSTAERSAHLVQFVRAR